MNRDDAPAGFETGWPDASLPRLELRGARLQVVGDELIRRNSRGGVVLRLRLDAIDEVTVRSRLDPMAAVILAFGLGLAALGCFVSESNILTTILYVIALLGAALAVIGIARTEIGIRLGEKTVPVYPSGLVADGPDEVAGFVASLQAELNDRRRGLPGRV
jgi:hypothetical protein